VSHYTAPLDDIRFNLEAFGYTEKLVSLPAFEDFDIDTAMAMLSEYAKFCENELAPLNGKADRAGLVYNPEDKSVTTPEGFREVYQKFVENGFLSLSHPEEWGGAGGPHTLGFVGSEVLIAANKSFSMCPGLSNGLIDALVATGTDELKERYLEKLCSGEWSGTMCLTEPQCGTDLGLLTTKAEAHGDHYKLTGTKIWITFGEHDLADNIIHLVLARLPGAPPGIKGISTFVVPKFLEDGTYNNVSCGGLEHKMGIHASPTCVINLDGSEGWLVGEPGKGMRTMFIMMNAARLSVGIEGYALAEAAYQAALSFAKDRRQSRSLNPARRDEQASADNILVHPDVRRMLLNVKSTNEALRGLAAWIAINYDLIHHSVDEDTRNKAKDLVALLTPVMKSYGSERGCQNISESMQVMGGAGYTQDWPVEQIYRDARIAMIYEGTNHIQALDLVGRKLPRGNGRLLMTFAQELQEVMGECAGDPELEWFATELGKQAGRLQQVTMDLGGKMMADAELAGAAASNYLNFFALVTLGTVWLKQLLHVSKTEADDSDLKRAKFQTARFFFSMVLPEATLFAKLAQVGKEPMMDFDPNLL
jgi:alkylation response protein AidB-like acyl-CoA dehydrogenase